MDDLRAILAGTVKDTPAALRETDMLGLNPVMAACLLAATRADNLTPLLDLLTPAQPDGEAPQERILALLESMAEAIARTERRVIALEAMMRETIAPSSSRPKPVTTVSPR